jgi:hypothetical protein
MEKDFIFENPELPYKEPLNILVDLTFCELLLNYSWNFQYLDGLAKG